MSGPLLAQLTPVGTQAAPSHRHRPSGDSVSGVDDSGEAENPEAPFEPLGPGAEPWAWAEAGVAAAAAGAGTGNHEAPFHHWVPSGESG